MKIAAMIILYHPCQETIDNINSYYDYADKIYVFDNTEQQTILKDQLLLQTKISYHHNGRNEGIAKRLNEAAHLCIADEFDWLMHMDQDSGFTEPMIKNICKVFINISVRRISPCSALILSRIFKQTYCHVRLFFPLN